MKTNLTWKRAMMLSDYVHCVHTGAKTEPALCGMVPPEKWRPSIAVLPSCATCERKLKEIRVGKPKKFQRKRR